MKEINWKNIAVIAVVSILAVTLVYPMVKPWLQKLPVVGTYFA